MPPYDQIKKKPSNDIEKAMERKEQSIKSFIDKKEQGMAIMAAGRDACMIVTAMLSNNKTLTCGDYSDAKVQENIKKWSKWFLDQYTKPF